MAISSVMDDENSSLLQYSSVQQAQSAGIISRGHIAEKPVMFIPRAERLSLPLHHEFFT